MNNHQIKHSFQFLRNNSITKIILDFSDPLAEEENHNNSPEGCNWPPSNKWYHFHYAPGYEFSMFHHELVYEITQGFSNFLTKENGHKNNTKVSISSPIVSDWPPNKACHSYCAPGYSLLMFCKVNNKVSLDFSVLLTATPRVSSFHSMTLAQHS